MFWNKLVSRQRGCKRWLQLLWNHPLVSEALFEHFCNRQLSSKNTINSLVLCDLPFSSMWCIKMNKYLQRQKQLHLFVTVFTLRQRAITHQPSQESHFSLTMGGCPGITNRSLGQQTFPNISYECFCIVIYFDWWGTAWRSCVKFYFRTPMYQCTVQEFSFG